ncbi:MAG: YkgJ family cysteine cluster protein [Verrucomicrobiota bacterium]
MNEEDALEEMARIYNELEGLRADRDCRARTTCCQFGLTGRTPMLTSGEALMVVKGLRASGRKGLPASEDPGKGRCPLLGKDGRCWIYDHRPFGCRTHFCAAAGGDLPRKAIHHLIQRLETLAEKLGDSDVRKLPDAVQHSLGNKTARRGRR